MAEIRFEWNEAKNRANRAKHGIDFQEAATVFFDEHALLVEDPDHSEAADRFVLLGLSARFRVLLVCHCYQEHDNVIRLISARRANRRETDEYWKRLRQ